MDVDACVAFAIGDEFFMRNGARGVVCHVGETGGALLCCFPDIRGGSVNLNDGGMEPFLMEYTKRGEARPNAPARDDRAWEIAGKIAWRRP